MLSRIFALIVFLAAVAGGVWYVLKPRPWREVYRWDREVRAFFDDGIGDAERARELNEKVLSVLPGSVPHLVYKTRFHLLRGRPEDIRAAIETCDKILDRRGEGFEYGGLLKADLLRRLGRAGEARSTLLSIADVAPFSALQALGDLALAQLQPLEALAQYRRALEAAIQPEDEAAAQEGIARSYLLLRDLSAPRGAEVQAAVASFAAEARKALEAALDRLRKTSPAKDRAEARVLEIARVATELAALEGDGPRSANDPTPLERAYLRVRETLRAYEHLLPVTPPSVETQLGALRLRTATEESALLPADLVSERRKEAERHFAAALFEVPERARELLDRIPEESRVEAPSGGEEGPVRPPRTPAGVEYAGRLLRVARVYLASSEFRALLEDVPGNELALARRIEDAASSKQEEVARAFRRVQGLARLRAGDVAGGARVLADLVGALPPESQASAWIEDAGLFARLVPGDPRVFEFLDKSRPTPERPFGGALDPLRVLVEARRHPALREEASKRIDAALDAAIAAAKGEEDRLALATLLKSLRSPGAAIELLEAARKESPGSRAIRRAVSDLFAEKASAELARPGGEAAAFESLGKALEEETALFLERPGASQSSVERIGRIVNLLNQRKAAIDLVPAVRKAFPGAPPEAASALARATLGEFLGEVESGLEALAGARDRTAVEPFASLLEGTLRLRAGARILAGSRRLAAEEAARAEERARAELEAARAAFERGGAYPPCRAERLRLDLDRLSPLADVPEDLFREIEKLKDSEELEHQGYFLLARALRHRYRARYLVESVKNSELVRLVSEERHALREAIRRNPNAPQVYAALSETFLLGPPWDLEGLEGPDGKPVVVKDRSIVDLAISGADRRLRAARALLASPVADEALLERLSGTLAALAAAAADPAERARLLERSARTAETRALRWPSATAFTQLIALTLAMPEGPSGALLSETPPPDPSARPGATEREKTLYELRAKLDALPEAEGIRQSFLALQLAASDPGRASDPAFARAVAERYEKALAAYDSRGLDAPLLVLNNLAWYSSESGDEAMRARAVEIAERARKLVPRPQLGFDVYDTYAWALYRAGRFAEARAVLERVLAEAPRLRPEQAALVHYRLGRVFQGLRDYDAALGHVQQALSSGARFAEEAAARELERQLVEERRKILGGG